MPLKRTATLLTVLLMCLLAHTQIITTFAGTGTLGYSGDGGPATSARLHWQIGLAKDNSGNIYIADHDNNVIRKVNSAGIISTFAGNHSLGYSGDGGPATSAQLYHPGRMATDNLGNLYFTDQNAEVIRKVDLAGIITSLTTHQPLGGYSGDGGPLMTAFFRTISGLGFDNAGNMYIADYGNHVIRKVNAAGIITTVAGNGTSGFSGDGGPATSAQLSSPYGVVFDNAGNMYIPDPGNNRIRMVNSAGIITTIAGTGARDYSGDGGPAVDATFNAPWSLSIDNANNLYVTDALNNVIRKITAAGIVSTFAGNGGYGYSGDGGPATDATMTDLCDAIVDNGGNVYISQRTPFYVIRKVNNCLVSSITQQPADASICNTGNASFNVVAADATDYQWQVNPGTGWADIADGGVYSGTNTNNLGISGATGAMNSYRYRCALRNSCATIFSATALLTISNPATTSITINTISTDVCAGTSVTFTAAATGAGPSPVYQWKKNGMNTGSGGTTYNDNSLVNGDIISCELTPSGPCFAGGTIPSNNITLTVTDQVMPTATITASQNNTCAGTPVTFTASIQNGGATPAYTWFKNGTNLFLNSPVYTDNVPANGDIIMCAFRSSLSCVISPIGVSNEVVMNIVPQVAPSVTISTSAASFCRGTSVTFTAAAINGGLSPIYQWKKNDNNVGGNDATLTDNNLVNGDRISCDITSNAACVSATGAASNTITVTVFENPQVTLDKTNTLCAGSSRQLDAGNYSSYLWNNGSTFRTQTITSTGIYYVTVTDVNGCRGSDTSRVTTWLPQPTGFIPPDTAICSYGTLQLAARPGYRDYWWSTGSTSATTEINTPGTYSLEVIDNSGCKGLEMVNVLPKECMKGFYIPTAFSPNNDGRNDVFKPFLFGNVQHYDFRIYNRWGTLIFQTKDVNKGWDGSYKGIKMGNEVFVWTCSYLFTGEEKKLEKGTVMLVK